jgi:hypothetical protein
MGDEVNAFEDARCVEREIMKLVLPFIGERAMDGRFVVTDKGRLSKELQALAGDVLFNRIDPDTGNGRLVCVEVKGERKWTGNLFLEVWSNRSYDPAHPLRPGWLISSQADLLLYGFLTGARLPGEPWYDTCPFYAMSLPRLQTWAFGCGETPGRIWHPDFREVTQRAYCQKNETVGRIVPISVLENEIGLRTYILEHGEEGVA